MSTDVWGYVIGGGFALAASWMTVRATRKSQEITEKARLAIAADEEKAEKWRADGEAYERAQQINRETVTELRSEVTRLQGLLAEQRVQSKELELQVAKFRRDVGRLTLLLERHDIPLPESMNGGG